MSEDLNGSLHREALFRERVVAIDLRFGALSMGVSGNMVPFHQGRCAGERTSSPNGPDEQAMPDERTMQSRRRRVEESAYYRAERRGFAPGAELDDWYAAEAEEDERDGDVADRTQSEGDGRGGASRSRGG